MARGRISVLSSNPTGRAKYLAARLLSTCGIGEAPMERMRRIAREQDIHTAMAEGEAVLFKHSPT